MTRRFILAATIAAIGLMTVAPMLAVAKSGGTGTGSNSNQGSPGFVGNVITKPQINKNLGLRFRCYRVPHKNSDGTISSQRVCEPY